MIIDPDFLDHWKTRTLVVALNDEMAPLYLIRLWAHCQLRKTSKFEHLPPQAIKAICRYPGDAIELDNLLVTHGYTDRVGDSVVVCGWAEANAYLVNAWENGSRGGRKKSSLKNSVKKPVGYPVGTPTGVAEEKRREEKNTTKVNLSSNTDSDSFDLFWREYPKRVAKPAAVKAFAAACKRLASSGVSFPEQHIVTRTRAYGAARLDADPKFTPNPATWLNQARFDDDPATWGEATARAGPRNKPSNLELAADFLKRHGATPNGNASHPRENDYGDVRRLESPHAAGHA